MRVSQCLGNQSRTSSDLFCGVVGEIGADAPIYGTSPVGTVDRPYTVYVPIYGTSLVGTVDRPYTVYVPIYGTSPVGTVDRPYTVYVLRGATFESPKPCVVKADWIHWA
jgi:hypothetical protein